MGIAIKYKQKRKGLAPDEVRDMLKLSNKDFLLAMCKNELTVKRDKTISFGNVVKYCRKHNIKIDPVEYARRMSKINAEVI